LYHILSHDRVIFTGYLTHQELRYLFPCCDVSVFPSIAVEAGPLVFLESLASGCFPIGTYFGGMAESIDSVAIKLPKNVAELMKITTSEENLVFDLANKVSNLLLIENKHKEILRDIAVQFYDWENVSKKLWIELESM